MCFVLNNATAIGPLVANDYDKQLNVFISSTTDATHWVLWGLPYLSFTNPENNPDSMPYVIRQYSGEEFRTFAAAVNSGAI